MLPLATGATRTATPVVPAFLTCAFGEAAELHLRASYAEIGTAVAVQVASLVAIATVRRLTAAAPPAGIPGDGTGAVDTDLHLAKAVIIGDAVGGRLIWSCRAEQEKE